MSSSTSQSSALNFGPAARLSSATTSFQSPDLATGSSSLSFGGLDTYPGSNFRMKSEASPYAHDEQAPRSQQPHGANYTHQDLGHVGGLAQTQALGGGVGQQQQQQQQDHYHHYQQQQYSGGGGESSRSATAAGGGHTFPQHTRHSSLASSIGHLGLSGGGNEANGAPFQNYGAYSEQRTGLTAGTAETSPTRSRFPTAGHLDARQVVRSQPGRPVGLGVGMAGSLDAGSPKLRSVDSSNSPRSLKRAAEYLEDPRGSMDYSGQLRRPASFPVINASLGGGGGTPYGRPLQADPRSAQTLERSRGRGGLLGTGQTTPGRPPMMLPGPFCGAEHGRRDSFSSNQTVPSPFMGSSGSSEELPSPYPMGGFPQLVRSTQIPGSSSSGVGGSIGSGDPGYSPPALPDAPKARLELHGNLNDMAVGWSHDEWRSGRRLVQFWRRQEGSTIHATWRPITPSQYVPNSIVISCIFRDEKNECFITSVDTIYLLEALVASRFTVEEKNRIRRNLEGFRPITVSKSKRECDAFFKRIMSFPNPKPRNIEKDVKVFPWKVLSSALCKIISKYSPLYEPSMVVSDHWAPELGAGAPPPPQQQQQGAGSISAAAKSDYRDGSDYAASALSSSVPAFRSGDGLFERSGGYSLGPIYGAPQHGGGAGGGGGPGAGGGTAAYSSMYGAAAPASDLHSRSRSTGSTFAFQELMPGGGPPGGGMAGLGHPSGSGYPPASGPTDAIPFPSQGGHSGYSQQHGQQQQHHEHGATSGAGGYDASRGYDAFSGGGAGVGAVGNADASTSGASNGAANVGGLFGGQQKLPSMPMQDEGRSSSASTASAATNAMGHHHRDMSGSTLAGATGYYSTERRG